MLLQHILDSANTWQRVKGTCWQTADTGFDRSYKNIKLEASEISGREKRGNSAEKGQSWGLGPTWVTKAVGHPFPGFIMPDMSWCLVVIYLIYCWIWDEKQMLCCGYRKRPACVDKVQTQLWNDSNSKERVATVFVRQTRKEKRKGRHLPHNWSQYRYLSLFHSSD